MSKSLPAHVGNSESSSTGDAAFNSLRVSRRTFFGCAIGVVSGVGNVGASLSKVGNIVAPKVVSMDVGTLAGHLLHNCWGAARTLPKLQEVVFNLGTRVQNPDFLDGEEFELAFNLVKVSGATFEDVSYERLELLRSRLVYKIEYADALATRLRNYSTGQPHGLSLEDLQEINQIFKEPFSHSNSDGFPLTRNEADTPAVHFNDRTESLFRDQPLKLISSPYFREFILRRIGDGVNALHKRIDDTSKVLQFIDDNPTSLLGRIAVGRDATLFKDLCDLGRSLEEGYMFPTPGCGGMVDHYGWARRTDLVPKVPYLESFYRPRELGKPLVQERLDQKSFRELRGCTHAFIFRYGPWCKVESEQPLPDTATSMIMSMLSGDERTEASHVGASKLEVFTFTIMSTLGDCRVDSYQPLVRERLLSWVDKQYGGRVDAGRLCAVKAEGGVTLYDLLSKEPIDYEMTSATSPNFPFLALEYLVAQHLFGDSFPLGAYAIKRRYRSDIVLQLVTQQNTDQSDVPFKTGSAPR